jgi:hypothetical protein
MEDKSMMSPDEQSCENERMRADGPKPGEVFLTKAGNMLEVVATGVDPYMEEVWITVRNQKYGCLWVIPLSKWQQRLEKKVS